MKLLYLLIIAVVTSWGIWMISPLEMVRILIKDLLRAILPDRSE